jgi:hypothetical protein
MTSESACQIISLAAFRKDRSKGKVSKRAAVPQRPEREVPEVWDMVLLGRARSKGVEAVARLVSMLPMSWEGRLNFYSLTDQERQTVAALRKRMKGKTMNRDTVKMVLGLSNIEMNMMEKEGLLPILGSNPPFWAGASWHPTAKWERLYDYQRVMGMVANDEVGVWRAAVKARRWRKRNFPKLV